MSNLFKDRVIKEKLEHFQIDNVENKISILQNWYRAYNIGELQKKTETQCEQAFNADIFVSILGYTSFPNEIYTLQPKGNVETGGGQLPDATLGYFSSTTSKTISVVEIKDVLTSLDKSQYREGRLSPIQQAFKYKPMYRDCKFVIATNFYEIRIYADNQIDFEKFTLKELVDKKDDFYNFRKFYYLLCQQNFIRENGHTETEKLLTHIRVEQEDITKKFYEDYKKLRQDLIRDITKNNRTQIKSFYSIVVEKAQKLIDRIVLVSFFEDCGLLPDNKLYEVVQKAEEGFFKEPIWDTLKKFFRAIDEGSERLGIPHGYNGELFKNDEALNKLVISDEICTKFINFTKYNFDEDLSVTILGHIFEQSISDLERLRNYSLGKEVELEKKDSKRKKDGIFYTPDPIIDFIVKNTLGQYLEEKENEILEKYKLDSKRIRKKETTDKKAIAAYEEYLKIIRSVTVLDPACGSGSFPVKVYDYLLAENKRVIGILTDLHGGVISLMDTEENIKAILQNNIYGVDLNQESVEITKLSLWLKSANKGEKLVTLKENIKCGNSLIESNEIAGDKAFNWKSEFKNIFDFGGFDVVIGNPPYVFARGGNFSEDEKKYYYSKYKLNNYQINTYLLFIELGYKLLKKGGKFGYIIPNTWLTINSFSSAREFLIKNTGDLTILNCTNKIFEQANVDTCILLFSKSEPTEVSLGELTKEHVSILSKEKVESFKEKGFVIKIRAAKPYSLNLTNTVELGSISEVKSGLKAYEVGKGNPNQTKEMKDKRTYHSYTMISSDWRPYLQGSDVKRYSIDWSGEYLRYGDHLAAPRKKEMFVMPRILIRQIPSKPPYSINAVFTNSDFLNDINSHIVFRLDEKYNYSYVLGVLNSKLITYWFNDTFDKFQRKLFPQFKVNELQRFPIFQASKDDQQKVAQKVERITALLEKEKRIKNKFQEVIKAELKKDRIAEKATHITQLNFNEFLSVLKVSTSLREKETIFDFYNSYRQELVTIQSEMMRINEQVDEMIMDIYKLSDNDKLAIRSFPAE